MPYTFSFVLGPSLDAVRGPFACVYETEGKRLLFCWVFFPPSRGRDKLFQVRKTRIRSTDHATFRTYHQRWWPWYQSWSVFFFVLAAKVVGKDVVELRTVYLYNKWIESKRSKEFKQLIRNRCGRSVYRRRQSTLLRAKHKKWQATAVKHFLK